MACSEEWPRVVKVIIRLALFSILLLVLALLMHGSELPMRFEKALGNLIIFIHPLAITAVVYLIFWAIYAVLKHAFKGTGVK